jgi:CheY-like chemotaxis protein
MSENPFRVLIAEDSETVRDILSFLLQSNGFKTYEAFDGVSAIKEVIQKKPDLILLDVDMPRMNGYQVCRIVKADPEFMDTPVIMLTSRDRQLDKMWGLSTGADDYVIKAMDEDNDDDGDSPFPSLGDAIERCLKGKTPSVESDSSDTEITDGEVFNRLNGLLDQMLFRMTLRRKVSDLSQSLQDLNGTVRSIVTVMGDVTGFAGIGLSLCREKQIWMYGPSYSPNLGVLLTEKTGILLSGSVDTYNKTLLSDICENSDVSKLKFIEVTLKSRQETIGTVVAAYESAGEIDSAIVDIFYLLAENAAIVLDNAQLFCGLEKTNDELQQTLDKLTSTQVKLEETQEKVAQLEILIDEKKKSKKVSAIVDSEYFDSLKNRIKKLRDS